MTIKEYHVSIMFICFVTIFSELSACTTTFVNDSSTIKIVHDRNSEHIFLIKRNGKRRFGGSQWHAYFDVYVQQPKIKFFRLAYTCQQYDCSKNGNTKIKFSDLANGQGPTHLFTITRNEKPDTSMVNDLPMIQKKIDYPVRGANLVKKSNHHYQRA